MARKAKEEQAQVQTSLPQEAEMIELSKVPAYESSEWSDYVMSLFSHDELIDGRPTRNGLARMIHHLVGPVLESGVEQITPGNLAYTDRILSSPAVVVWKTVVQPTKLFGLDFPSPLVYKEVAEVHDGNCEAKFVRFGLSTAATRAEVRTYRKILRLGAAADEMTSVPVEVCYSNKTITDAQVIALDALTHRLDVDSWGFLNAGKNKYSKVEEIPWETAAQMIDTLSSWQSSGKVPQSFKGYKKDWRK